MIFDLDGTLVDSQLDFAAMRRDLRISSELGILESIAAIQNSKEQQRLLGIVHSHEMAGASRATPISGANELLRMLKPRDIKTAIFTRNSKLVTERSLQCLDVEIPLIVAREDAPPKPDPAGLLLILDKWKFSADEVLFVGDYLYDLEAGKRAGIQTLLFTPAEPDFTHDHPEVISGLMAVIDYL